MSDQPVKAPPGFTWATPILCVNDMPQSLQHCRDVLGFEIAWSWSDHDAFDAPQAPTFACVCRGDISIFLCEQDQGKPGAWVCLNVADRDALMTLHAEYAAAGACIDEPPEDRSWGMCEMLVRDPDGNVFRIGCVLPST